MVEKDELFRHFKSLPQVQLSADSVTEKLGRTNPAVQSLPELAVQHQSKEPMSALRQFSESFNGKVVFSVESEGRREALLELLQSIKLRPIEHISFSAATQSSDKFTLVLGASEHGFLLVTIRSL